MFDRTATLSIRNEISGYNPFTTYQVKDGLLYVRCPGGLAPEQKELVTAHRDDLVELFTTPPAPGQCARGHAIDWQLSPHGTWLCSCYFNPPELVTVEAHNQVNQDKPENTRASKIRDYWKIA